ncbi:putative 2-aminoethylphosphonate ABC transporter ATP-binding protein [Cohnella abietis]|uniref:2-aminoethylphosphonate ABC transporter ATP-binding protein n=1 Tax=Cohnella abietis TaxID=2507935 RepID=A0A3T1DDA6_9BACL|nr:putative 2-aminoethylphosphonate ABC transporter ATP-binding protein [Cohnella abietis]BBI35935.1 2-aminoethylphosphonate ABC transporter ATP-binding protein [Cohnella abietis]
MNKPHLTIQGINKSFGTVAALKDVNLEIHKNEFVCLLGPSGCGKTTLLRIIAGLEKASSGRILAGGKDISMLPPAKRNFGMVFQSYALFPNLTAYQNVAYGLQGKSFSKKDIGEKVQHVLKLVDLSHASSRYPSQLSGGQQQRIALARAIVLSPDFLLLDEPLSALDAKVRVRLRHEIRELQERLGITTIMVTHDQEEALTMSDRIVVMNNAEVQQIGTPQEVYEQPNSPFVADFIGSINFLHDKSEGAAPTPRWAVRPEHIRISAEGTGEGVSAIVKNIEFRGSFYRLLLETESVEAGGGHDSITVDVSAHVSNHLQLMKNGIVSLEVPKEKLISFTSEARIHA